MKRNAKKEDGSGKRAELAVKGPETACRDFKAGNSPVAHSNLDEPKPPAQSQIGCARMRT